MDEPAVTRHSIVIPLRFDHWRFALSLVASIRSWEIAPYEIIVAASEVPRQRHLEFERQLVCASGMDPVRVRLLSTTYSATAGVNRNRGWAEAEGDWTLFVDADDIYRPERSQVLLELCNRTSAQAVFHSFAYLESPRRFLRGSLRRGPGEQITTSGIQRASPTHAVPPSNTEPDRHGSSNLSLPSHGPPAIHHGHLTIKTELRQRFAYADLPYGEDGLLAQDLVRSSVPIVVTPWILSLYDPWRWRLPLPDLARNVKRKTMAMRVRRQSRQSRV